MCTLFENIAKEGELKGAARQIVRMGHDFGLNDSDIVSKLRKELDLSLQAAQEYLLMFGKQKV